MGLSCQKWWDLLVLFVLHFPTKQKDRGWEKGQDLADEYEEGKIRLCTVGGAKLRSYLVLRENFTQINLTAQKMRTRLQLYSEVSSKSIFRDPQCECDTQPQMIYIYIIYQLCKYSAVKLSSDERLPTAQLCSEFKEFYQSYLINLQTFNEPNKVKIAVQWKKKNKE